MRHDRAFFDEFVLVEEGDDAERAGFDRTHDGEPAGVERNILSSSSCA